MSEQLKKLETDVVTALKGGDRERVNVLRQYVNRVKMAAKNDKNREPTDADVLAAGLKIVKEARETIDIYVERGVSTDEQDREIEIVSEYLPKQMTPAELRELIVTLMADAPQGKAARGHIMKVLNGEYRGQFDNRLAQTVLGEYLD